MIRLDLNVPAIYEGYHAIWHSPRGDEPEGTDVWRAEIPLTVQGQASGRLEAVGKRGLEPVWTQIATLMNLAESLEKTAASLSRREAQIAGAQKNLLANGDAVPKGRRAWGLSRTNLAANGPAGT
jgi:hypothetical protein